MGVLWGAPFVVAEAAALGLLELASPPRGRCRHRG
jgi:hypothetical protein